MLRIAVGFLVMAGISLSIGRGGREARAQDDWDVAQRPSDSPERNGHFLVLPNFDQWALGGNSREQLETRIRSQLALFIELADKRYKLSAPQREKLRLAGEGDLKRLVNMIDCLQNQYNEIGRDANKFDQFTVQASILQNKMRSDLFDESSLYQKVSRQILNKEQLARCEEQELGRLKFLYKARIELAVANLNKKIPLRADQRKQLVKLILDETEPPRKAGRYLYMTVCYNMSKLDDEKLKLVLDDAQRQSFRQALKVYPAYEKLLRGVGYLP